jgi:crotonobetainyl-CoA:carnitine CoA-transferase CaiB-like acyl-CoA transferase
VLELGHFVAAPFAARLLADLGADVVKIEPPTGDPVRQWGLQVDGHSPWWSMHGRNKRSVTVDLKHPSARGLILELVSACDVVVENFRPGHLAKLGLDDDALRGARHDIVIAHISGYGQDGPHRDRPAFGVIGEAIGGMRYLTNHPPGVTDLPPVRVGVSIGDSMAGIYAAFGVMVSLFHRERHGADRAGRVDVALSEAVLSVMEGLIPEYAALGSIREPSGARIPTAAPTSAYPTADGQWILIAANSEPLFANLTRLMEATELAQDARFLGNARRVQNAAALDAIIASWTRARSLTDLEAQLTRADIPNARAFTAADVTADAQFRFRGMVRDVEDPHFGHLLHAGVVPHFPDDPGDVAWAGPEVGEHTDEVLRELAGLSPDRIAQLRQEGVV